MIFHYSLVSPVICSQELFCQFQIMFIWLLQLKTRFRNEIFKMWNILLPKSFSFTKWLLWDMVWWLLAFLLQESQALYSYFKMLWQKWKRKTKWEKWKLMLQLLILNQSQCSTSMEVLMKFLMTGTMEF